MKRFRMLAYTGVPFKEGFWGSLVIDLDGLKTANSRIPALRQHKHDRPVGVIDSLSKDTGTLIASGYFLDTPDGRECENLLRAGYPFQASIGVLCQAAQILKDGETAKVNSRMIKGPAAIWRQSLLGEISFVSWGLDHTTQVNLAASQEFKTLAKREWDHNPALRAEFLNDFSLYLAFKRAQVQGRAKIAIPRIIK